MIRGPTLRATVALGALLGAALAGPLRASPLPPDTTRASGPITFPAGEIFRPLLADPHEPRFSARWLRSSSSFRDTDVGAVGFGERFGLVRWPDASPGDGVQVGLAGGVFAQFDLESASSDLMNADYVIGLPVTARRGALSARVRIYHQSSHLGDEFLLREHPQRENLSFESIELLFAGRTGDFRVYGGGEYLVRRTPESLDPGVFHAGLEYRPSGILFRVHRLGGARLVAGLDARWWEQRAWAGAWSAKAGIELGPAREGDVTTRRLGLLVEAYDGPSPYGQFYPHDVRYLGVGVHFSL